MKHYEMLVADGNGAATRGGEADRYLEVDGDAENVNEFIKDNWDAFFGESAEDWFESYGPIPEDLVEFLQTHLDVSGGDPWIEGLIEDGKTLIEADINGLLEYGADIDYDTAEKWFGKDGADQLCNFDDEENYDDDDDYDGEEFDPNDDDVDENLDIYDADHAAEWMEKHPYGWYNSESDYGTGDEDDDNDDDDVDESLKNLSGC